MKLDNMPEEKEEPKSWKDIIADGIEAARSETVAALESAWTGKDVEAERFEYEQIDLGSFFASDQPQEQQEDGRAAGLEPGEEGPELER